jgi:hypothetical protein
MRHAMQGKPASCPMRLAFRLCWVEASKWSAQTYVPMWLLAGGGGPD